MRVINYNGGRKGQKGRQKGEKEDTQRNSGPDKERAGKPDFPDEILTSGHPTVGTCPIASLLNCRPTALY